MPSATARGHVLAVDDCATTRELIRASLESAGYEVQLADSGWAALAAARNDAFDAIVLDVEMPDLDGLALGRLLRECPATAEAMIAIHSSVDESRVRARFSQYDLYVPKSAPPVELGSRVDGMIRSRRARQR